MGYGTLYTYYGTQPYKTGAGYKHQLFLIKLILIFGGHYA